MSFIYPRPTKNYHDTIVPNLVPISVLTDNEIYINYSDVKERLRILEQNKTYVNVINESSEQSQHLHEQQAEAKRDN